MPVSADTWPYTDHSKLGRNQPVMYGERIIDLENWSPKTDPFAELMRAEVPLQQRIKFYQPTQAKPGLKSDAEIMYMAGDYGNSFTQATPYNNQFSEYHFNFWQYIDYYAAWHGAVVANTPLSLWTGFSEDEDTSGNGWATRRNFEFGTINMPNPGYTNAAHKNGVLSLGCIYFDPNNRPGQPVTPMLKQDTNGSFPIAEKLTAYAIWYGFDGWFFNQEETIPKEQVPLYKAFIKQVRESGLYCQMYDAMDTKGEIDGWRSQLDENIYTFLDDPDIEKVNDSIFISYDWPAKLKNGKLKLQTTLDTINKYKIDPYKNVFFGVEASQGKMSSTAHNSTFDFPVLYKNTETKELYGSVALFTPDSFIHDDIENAIKNGSKNNRAKDEYQWMVMERERLYFSGPAENPADAGVKPNSKRADLALDNIGGFGGVAEFASERSVSGGSNFYSNFNTGHGLEYWIDGKITSSEEYSNMNLQDILPTWQWWIDSAGSKLNVDFDYGTKYKMCDKNGKPIAFDYQQIGGYTGGSSLAVSGKLDASNLLHLFKTDLTIDSDSRLSIGYYKVSEDNARMQAALTFEGESAPALIDIPDSYKKSNGWSTAELPLSSYSGKHITSINLYFTGKSKEYQINIGEIKITDGKTHTPVVPQGFKLSHVFETGEIIAEWEKLNYNTVRQYRLYAVYEDGKKEFLGGIYGSNYYIKSVNQNLKGIELTAVGIDGSESVPAYIDYNYDSKVQNIKVKEAAASTGFFFQSAVENQVEISFDNPKTGNYTGFYIELSLNNNDKYTSILPAKERTIIMEVPVKEGGEYTLCISTIDGNTINEPICYTGHLKDTYCETYTGNVTFLNKKAEIETPAAKDWWHIFVTYDNKTLTIPVKYPSLNQASAAGTKGTARINAIELPYTGGKLGIQLEDYSGNLSEITYINYDK